MSRRRVEISRKVLAVLGIVGLGIGTVAVVVGVLVQLSGKQPRQALPAQNTPSRSQPTIQPTTPAGPPIRPLAVRPVLEQRPTTPEQCPADGQMSAVPPAEEFDTCDFARTAAYTLGPEVMTLQLTRVESARSATTDEHVVRVTMQPASALAFANYTADHVGGQLAFIRDGVVVFAPKITGPIKSVAIEISGNLTAQQADNVVRLLAEPA